MFHSQKNVKDKHGVVKNKYIIPKYNYQTVKDTKPPIQIEEAHIIHFHSSRDSKGTIEKMKEKLNI